MHISNLSPAEVSRYSRQLALDGWGREAQERLKSCRVLIAGVQGLGSMAALHLLASGVGAIRLVDETRVGLSDLNHQILFRERDLGKAKAAVAEQRLKELNPFTIVEGRVKDVSERNLVRLLSGCNLVIDALNNPPAAQLLNLGATRLHLPLVHAWVWGMEGRLTTCWAGKGPCLACAFPELPPPSQPAVLGPLPGIFGSLQALEVLRILGGLGPALLGRLLTFKGHQFRFMEQTIKANPHCLVCGELKAST
jgi:adenylyltransferase/sulfurtransferase